MTVRQIKQELLAAGLHQESVERLLDHFQSMQFRLRQGEYEEAGTHLGNFCENMTNIILDKMGEPVQDRPNVGEFVNKATSGAYGTNEPRAVRLVIPNMIRSAYDLRNNRDSVHVNLKIPVNHSDSQTGVRMCSWMLAEIIRVYGNNDGDLEEIRQIIEGLSNPVTSYIDEYGGDRLVQHTGLDVREEILVHLRDQSGKDVDVNDLVKWIPDKGSRSVKRSLSHMAEDRLIWYNKEEETASITQLGVETAEEIEKKHFGESAE
jgi:hypothetical protein